jgi:hypothetical protein
MGAFRDRKAADDHKQRGNDGRGIHPAPGANLWNVLEHQIADDRPGQRANGLEGEGAEHKSPAHAARNAFGNDQMGGRIIAAERYAEAEQENNQPNVTGAHHQQAQEDCKNNHFDNEHGLAAEIVG